MKLSQKTISFLVGISLPTNFLLSHFMAIKKATNPRRINSLLLPDKSFTYCFQEMASYSFFRLSQWKIWKIRVEEGEKPTKKITIKSGIRKAPPSTCPTQIQALAQPRTILGLAFKYSSIYGESIVFSVNISSRRTRIIWCMMCKVQIWTLNGRNEQS